MRLVLINSLLIISLKSFSIDVKTEGKLITNFPKISKNPIVRMYFNGENNTDKIPVINLTPSRSTLVQFPEEVNRCDSAYKLISFDYGDNLESKQGSQGTGTATNTSSEWYSAVSFSVNPEAIRGLTAKQLLSMPVSNVNCKIRVSSPDSKSNESYTWKSIGIKIVDPDDTYLTVYLMNPDFKTIPSSLMTEKELDNFPYVDVTKLQAEKNKKQSPQPFISKNIETKKPKKELEINKNKEIVPKEKSVENEMTILDLYDFKDSKIKKSEVKKF